MRRQGTKIEESERAQPVVHGNRDHIAPRDQPSGLVLAACPGREAAAMKPDHDRQRLHRIMIDRRGDVEKQAVLAADDPWLARPTLLRTYTAGLGGVADPTPQFRGPGRLPSQL